MRKSTKILLGIFCVGVLLIGIGCGVAFLEFSSLEYTGNDSVFGEATGEKTFELVIEPTEQDVIYLGDSPREYAAVTYSSDIPENTIRWTVAYNETVFEPELYVDNYYYNGTTQKRIDVWGHYTSEMSDFAIFMTLKDRILADLKQHKIGSYEDWNFFPEVHIEVSESLAGYIREWDGIIYNEIYLDSGDEPEDGFDEYEEIRQETTAAQDPSTIAD